MLDKKELEYLIKKIEGLEQEEQYIIKHRYCIRGVKFKTHRELAEELEKDWLKMGNIEFEILLSLKKELKEDNKEYILDNLIEQFVEKQKQRILNLVKTAEESKNLKNAYKAKKEIIKLDIDDLTDFVNSQYYKICFIQRKIMDKEPTEIKEYNFRNYGCTSKLYIYIYNKQHYCNFYEIDASVYGCNPNIEGGINWILKIVEKRVKGFSKNIEMFKEHLKEEQSKEDREKRKMMLKDNIQCRKEARQTLEAIKEIRKEMQEQGIEIY